MRPFFSGCVERVGVRVGGALVGGEHCVLGRYTPCKHNALESGLGPPLHYIPLASLSRDHITALLIPKVEWPHWSLLFVWRAGKGRCFSFSCSSESADLLP